MANIYVCREVGYIYCDDKRSMGSSWLKYMDCAGDALCANA